jgi:hypothetical protein
VPKLALGIVQPFTVEIFRRGWSSPPSPVVRKPLVVHGAIGPWRQEGRDKEFFTISPAGVANTVRTVSTMELAALTAGM